MQKVKAQKRNNHVKGYEVNGKGTGNKDGLKHWWTLVGHVVAMFPFAQLKNS